MISLDSKSKRIHETAVLKAKKYRVAESELLSAIMDVDLNKTYEKFNCTHLTPYCIKHLGLDSNIAEIFVRVARKSVAVPELKSAVDEGVLSITKAKTIAAVLTPTNQKEWIDKALSLSKENLERAVVEVNPQLKIVDSARPVGPDRIRLELELSYEQWQLFKRAQDLVSQSLGKSASKSETLDTLFHSYLHYHDPVQKAERAKARKLKSKESDRSRDRSESIQNEGEIEHTSAKTNRVQVDCKPKKATLRNPGAASNRQRPIPMPVQHEVNLRDKGECQEILSDKTKCRGTRWVHHHHIIPRELGGQDTAENLTTLCSSHHRLLHKRNTWCEDDPPQYWSEDERPQYFPTQDEMEFAFQQ